MGRDVNPLLDLIELLPYLLLVSPLVLLYALLADKVRAAQAKRPLSEGAKRKAGEARYQGAVARVKAGNPSIDDLYRVAQNDRSYE